MKFKNLGMGIREIMDVLLLDVVERETKNGKSYTVLTVTDGEQTIDVKKWDSVLADYENLKNTVVTLNVKSSMYGSDLTYDTDIVTRSHKPVSDFIPKVPLEPTQMMNDIMARIQQMQDNKLRKLVEMVFNDHQSELMYWAAAKGMHHALYGGLLYHIYRMGMNADAQCNIYPELNRDLLVAGAYLHDIGKLMELNTSTLGTAEYTTTGSLVGHAYLGMHMLEDYGKKCDVPQNTVLQLQHMVASHHGNLEWGAVTVPQTMEAQMLHYLDMIDSRMYMYEDTYKVLEPGKPSNKIFGLGTSVFKF